MEDKQNEGYGIVSERSGGRQRRSSGRQRPEFGSFQSDTGTGLNIRVDWSVVRGVMGEKTLEVQVSTLSYSLYSIEMPSGVELTVNGAVSVGKSAAVNYSGRSQIASPLASFSVPNLSGTVQLSAVWHFNGSYSGVALSDIRASGTAVV